MEIRVEGLSLCLDTLETMFVEYLAQLREDHLHALLERLPIRLLHCHRSLKIVEKRQQIAEDILCDDGREFLLFFRCAAAKIFKIRLKPQDAVAFFLELRFERGGLVFDRRSLCSLRFGRGRRFRRVLHELLLRRLRGHLFLFLQAVHLSYHFS